MRRDDAMPGCHHGIGFPAIVRPVEPLPGVRDVPRLP